MPKTHILPAFEDLRGAITDVLCKESIDSVAVITFEKNAVRANHYHKETTQWNFLISGMLEVATQSMGKTDTVYERLDPNDLVISAPNEAHAFKALEYSVLLVLTQGPRAGTEYENDTFRLETSLFK